MKSSKLVDESGTEKDPDTSGDAATVSEEKSGNPPTGSGGEVSPESTWPVEWSTMDQLRNQLLGEPPTLTLRDLAERSDASLENAQNFWLAMGFPTLPVDEIAFTQTDLHSFQAGIKLVTSGLIDKPTAMSLLRAQSHTTDRLVLWQVEAVVDYLRKKHDLDDPTARLMMLDVIPTLFDTLEFHLNYAWRRQMYSLLHRIETEYSQSNKGILPPGNFPLHRSLGFIDLVAYTRRSKELGPHALTDLVQSFESISRDVITSRGARVVKTIGDAVLYISDDLETACDVVCALVDNLMDCPGMLPVRASLVEGNLVSISGDIFGPPVNLASRLVDVAKSGNIFIDADTAQAIVSAPWGHKYRVEAARSHELPGVGAVMVYILSRSELKR